MSLQTALVVDDSKLARITLKRLLEKHNLEVTTAESAYEALDTLKEKQIDIVFMDHLMPGMDGFEATQTIKATPEISHVPVIMCTGKEGVDNYDEQAAAIGASGTLSKPPQAEALKKILEQTPVPQPAEVEATPPEPATEGISKEAVKAQVESLITSLKEELERNIDDSANRVKEEVENRVIPKLKQELSLPSSEELQNRLFDERFNDRIEAMWREWQSEKPEPVDTDGLKKDIAETVQSNVESRISSRLEDFEAKLEETKIEKEQQENSSTEAAPAIDTESISAQVTQDVEGTLTSLFEGRLQEMEVKIQNQVDDAISESRKDLDSQLHESLQNYRDKMDALEAMEGPPSSDGGAQSDLSEELKRIEHEVSRASVIAAQESTEKMLSERMVKFREELIAMVNDNIPDADDLLPSLKEELFAEQAQLEASETSGLDDEQLAQKINEITHQSIRTEISEYGEELVGRITDELQSRITQNNQKIEEKHHDLEKQYGELLKHREQFEQERLALRRKMAGLRGSLFLLCGGTAIVAALAIVKSFGML